MPRITQSETYSPEAIAFARRLMNAHDRREIETILQPYSVFVLRGLLPLVASGMNHIITREDNTTAKEKNVIDLLVGSVYWRHFARDVMNYDQEFINSIEGENRNFGSAVSQNIIDEVMRAGRYFMQNRAVVYEQGFDKVLHIPSSEEESRAR